MITDSTELTVTIPTSISIHLKQVDGASELSSASFQLGLIGAESYTPMGVAGNEPITVGKLSDELRAKLATVQAIFKEIWGEVKSDYPHAPIVEGEEVQNE